MAITAGTKVLVEKGCKALGITKRSTAQIRSVVELGSEHSHAVRVEMHFLNSGKTFHLYTRHINRLVYTFVNLDDGNITHKIIVSLQYEQLSTLLSRM